MVLELNRKQSLMLIKSGACCSVTLLSSKPLYLHFSRQNKTSGNDKRETRSASHGQKGVVLLSFKSNVDDRDDRRLTGADLELREYE
jgi:hypothetical protein